MFGASAPNFNPDDIPDLTGRVALVTGGNIGLGRQSILAFLRKGAKVYMAARTESKALAHAIEEIKTEIPGAQLEFIQMDLQSFASIKAAGDSFIRKETHLHILFNNAGVMALPYSVTKDGYEVQFGTNHMGHFLLTKLLMPVMIKTAETAEKGTVRIVNVSSFGHNFAIGGLNFENMHRKNSSTWIRYGVSKLSNILHIVSLSKCLNEHGIICTALHPGFISSSLYDTAANSSIISRLGFAIMRQGFTSVEEGAYTQVYCGASDKVTLEDTGKYYVPTAVAGTGFCRPSGYAKDEGLAEKLWVWSEKELAEHGY